jgi:hypothetical protein
MTTTRLRSSYGALLLETNGDGWCRCTLEQGPAARYLGAETHANIATGLSRALDETFDGTGLHWVLSLAEAHHVLYAGRVGAELRLSWEDASSSPTRIVGTVTLSASERASWRDALARRA